MKSTVSPFLLLYNTFEILTYGFCSSFWLLNFAFYSLRITHFPVFIRKLFFPFSLFSIGSNSSLKESTKDLWTIVILNFGSACNVWLHFNMIKFQFEWLSKRKTNNSCTYIFELIVFFSFKHYTSLDGILSDQIGSNSESFGLIKVIDK